MDTCLVIDTSSYIALGLIDPKGNVLSKIILPDQKAGDVMDNAIEQLKEEAKSSLNISQICVCLGPGSFTGLRIGIAYGEGLAFPESLPIQGFSSLQLMLSLAKSEPTLAIIPARKDYFYISAKNFSEWEEGKENLLTSQELKDILPNAAHVVVPHKDSLPLYANFLKEYKSLDIIENYAWETAIKLASSNQNMERGIIKPNYIQKPAAELARLQKAND